MDKLFQGVDAPSTDFQGVNTPAALLRRGTDFQGVNAPGALFKGVNAVAALSLYISLTPDLLERAQSIPTISPFSVGRPRHLLSLLARTHTPAPHDFPTTVINANTGYSRTNHSPTVEHLLRYHATSSQYPTKRGLTVTILHTSSFLPVPKLDAVSCTAIAATVVQMSVAAALSSSSIASQKVVVLIKAGVCLSVLGSGLLGLIRARELQSARKVREKGSETVCITAGNGSGDALVVVTEDGGVKIEDIAAGRAGGPVGLVAGGAAVLLLAGWAAFFGTFVTLDPVDGWCVLGLAVLGTAVEVFAARTWRSAETLGFKVSHKKVVHREKVMETLKEVEMECEGAGAALVSVHFPGKLRPDEEAFWAARAKARAEGLRGNSLLP